VPAGAPRTTDLREVLNAIFYLLANGCAWHALPHDFPPEGTVRDYCHRWRRSGLWRTIPDALRRQVREQAGKEPQPSAGRIDSQTVKASRTAGTRGYDAGKKNQRRQTTRVGGYVGPGAGGGRPSAKIQDRDGAKLVFARLSSRALAADAARLGRRRLRGKLIAWVLGLCQWVLEVVKRTDDVKGFKLLPKRWVVERTFSWLSNYRRLSKHYEYWDETGEAMIHLAMIHLMLRRLTQKKPLTGIT
jgi:putative transposase